MKLSTCVVLSALLAPVAAFAPTSKTSSTSRLSAVNVDEFIGYYLDTEGKSEKLTNLPADQGFDPLKFSSTRLGMFWMREAEIKHCRLAMLAAAGWPIAELADRPLATLLHQNVIIDAADRNPSVLNGGLAKISPVYWGAILLAATFIDLYQINKANQDPNYEIGNLGFDPLNLYPKDEAGKRRMETTEIKNGRLAMIAITAFAAQEYVSQLGVVSETPAFFHPFGLF